MLAAFLIVHLVEKHLRVPHLHRAGGQLLAGLQAGGGPLGEADAVEPGIDGEHALQHILHGVVGAQFLGVEIIECLAAFLAPVAHGPGLQRGDGGAGLLLGKAADGFLLLQEGGAHLLVQAVDEVQRVPAATGHAAAGHVVGVALVAQQGGFLRTQGQDFIDERGVVELTRALGLHGAPHALAQGGILRKGEHRLHTGELQREAPLGGLLAAVALRQGILAGGLAGRFRQPGQLCFIGGHVFPGVGGVQHVLAESLGELGQLGGKFGIAGLLVLRQVGTALAEIGQGLADETLLHG